MSERQAAERGETVIRWDNTATTRIRLESRMYSLGHSEIEWDVARGHVRGTCKHGCTGILIEGVHSYGSGLRECPERES